MNTAEICAVLWEDEGSTAARKSQFRNLISDLAKTLQGQGLDGVFVKSRNSFSVRAENIDCDLYRFLSGDVSAVNEYRGEYMTQYAWAELTTGMLSGIFPGITL